MGPSFGFKELRANSPFNEEGSLVSYVGQKSYEIPDKDGIFLLTGEKVKHGSYSGATIIDIEVW